jgi:hypothetical protein
MTTGTIPPEPKAPVRTDHPSNRPRASHHHSPPPSGLIHAQMPATEQQLENDTLAQVEAWRLHQLLNAGWEEHSAELLANRPDIDLHLAQELIHNGCPQKLALKILL